MRTSLAQILLALGLLGASACEPNAFEMTLSGTTTISGDPVTAGSPLTRIPAIGSLASIDLGASEEFRHYGVSREQVQSIKVVTLVVRVVSPGTQGFDFLDTMSFVASDGSSEVPVATRDGIAKLGLDAPNPLLPLEVNPSADLRPFLSAPTISITARGIGRVPPQDTALQATVQLKVVLKLF